MAEYTIRDYAAREQVTPRTVRNWIAKGAIHARKNPGGSWRVIAPEGAPLPAGLVGRPPMTFPLRFINAPDMENCGKPRKS